MLAALLAELGWAGHPTVLVVEDVHWADEATLDVLRYLARRIEDLPAVLVLTYRDDELTRDTSSNCWARRRLRAGSAGCRCGACRRTRSGGWAPPARSTPTRCLP